MFPVKDFLEIGYVGRIFFFFFCFFSYTLLGDAHVGYFCATKQNIQILHKQYRFFILCADQNAKTKKFSSVIN